MSKKKVGNYYIHKHQILGTGQYGKVHLGEEITSKKKIAVKVIDKQKIDEDSYTKKALVREIQIMKAMHSPYIINFLSVHESQNNVYIFQELANGGTLGDLLDSQGPFNEEKTIHYCGQLVQGFLELAKFGIIHRDVKPANILISNNKLKLADFGFARSTENMSLINSFVGTPLYMSPQILNRGHYSYKCDIWSFGLICFQMLTNEFPWIINSNCIKQLFFDIKEQTKNGIVFPQNLEISAALKDFISGCLRIQEDNRFDWITIASHPIFKSAKIQFQNFGEQKKIREAFALTKLRMSVHAKNIKLSNIFSNHSQKITKLDLITLVKALDKDMDIQQIQTIFEGVAQDKKSVSQNMLMQYFAQNGFELEGVKLSKIFKAESIIITGIDQKIEELCKSIETKNINIAQICQRFGHQESGELDISKFYLLLQQINSHITKEESEQIFGLFSTEGIIPLKVCISKLSKLAMKPNIDDRQLEQRLNKLTTATL